MSLSLKKELHQCCLALVAQRIATAKEAMDAAQAAANNEGKSSAGDKYETGRAMMQLERDQHARLLAEALKLKQSLDAIDPAHKHEKAMLGSLTRTDQGNYFLSVSLGQLQIRGQQWVALSPLTPLGALLLGKCLGESLTFNKKIINILTVD